MENINLPAPDETVEHFQEVVVDEDEFDARCRRILDTHGFGWWEEDWEESRRQRDREAAEGEARVAAERREQKRRADRTRREKLREYEQRIA